MLTYADVCRLLQTLRVEEDMPLEAASVSDSLNRVQTLSISLSLSHTHCPSLTFSLSRTLPVSISRSLTLSILLCPRSLARSPPLSLPLSLLCRGID